MALAPALSRALLLAALSGSLLPARPAPAGADTPVVRRHDWSVRLPRPSWALESMLRDRLARGEPVPAEIVQRFRLDRPPLWSLESAPPEALAPREGPVIEALGNDHLVNDPAPDAGSCAGCNFLLHIQSETTIAAWGPNLLAGWNDSAGFCDNTSVHGWGWSVDGGATWVDGGGPPPLAGGGRYRGDPIHGVNRATGEFYVCGLYEGGTNGSGVACLRGHFSGGTFVVDDNRQVAVGGANFLDKPWMSVDSLSGHVYVSWTSFTNTGDQIELQTLDASLVPIGGVQVLSPPAANGLVQGSRPAVGPDGDVSVVWYQYGLPQSEIHVRRSTDFGVSFGAEGVVTSFFENDLNGAPGFLREFAPNFPSIAVDATTGPHRGRVYVAWDETVHFRDTPLGTGATVPEVETNDFFANPTDFTPGDVLTGALTAGDVDLFRFQGTAGQTLLLRMDASSDPSQAIAMRVVCSADTSSFNTYRFLAYTASGFPEICMSIPVTGTYLVRLNPLGNPIASYSLSTGWDTPSGDDRATHNRDKFACWSDDGVTWSTPVRINDAASADGIYPELAVDDLGRAWCYWHDFRDDPVCGAESVEYLTASGDGGLTWGPNEPLSDALSFWPPNTCRKPNQGDYQGATALDNRFIACWSDARLGDPDAYVEATAFQISSRCDPGALEVAPGAQRSFSSWVTNSGEATRPIHWEVSDTQGWTIEVLPAASGSASLAPASSVALQVTVHAPPGCDGTSDDVTVRMWDPLIAGREDSCSVSVACTGSAGVPAGLPVALVLEPPVPNPSGGGVRFDFALPRATFATLEILDTDGRRVRTVGRGLMPAGRRSLAWDGRGVDGALLPPGNYWARLTAAGEQRTRSVVRLR